MALRTNADTPAMQDTASQACAAEGTVTLNERWSLSMDALHDAASVCSFAQPANTTMPQKFMTGMDVC